MSPDPFFKKLDDAFEDLLYKERLLQELQDHAEDCEEDDKEVQPEELFGEVGQFKKQFIRIVDPWRSFILISEALSIGVALGIIGIMFSVTVNFSLQELATLGLLSDIELFFKKGIFIDFRFPGYALMIGVMWFFAYRFALNLFAESKALASFKESLWIYMLVSPIIFFFIIYAISQWPERYSFEYFLTLGTWVLVHGLVFSLAYYKYKKGRIELQDIKKWGFFLIPNVFVFTVLVFLVSLLTLQLSILMVALIFVLLNLLLILTYSFLRKQK